MNRRLPTFITQSRSCSKFLTVLQTSPAPTPPPEKDWFMDGREAARLLKLELEIMHNNNYEILDSETGIDGHNNFVNNDAVMESGRAAARELLKEMNTIDGNDGILDESSTHLLQTSIDDSIQQTKLEESSSSNYFDLPSRKSHCMTICLVPPPSATEAWEQFTTVRRECKDPGFYRWPPHANILYPFIEPVYNSEDGAESSIEDQRISFRNELATQLSKAVEKIQPFDVTIDSFGTFGNNQRGVLWVYPKSHDKQTPHDNEDEQPLIRLHRLLEQQFPMCYDTRKTGAFNPHMTISHYANNDDALIAKENVESGWRSVSFHVPEIYMLERRGDDGQFKVSATIPLGVVNSKVVEFYDPPISFPAMPEVEEKWVHDERMDMKSRRKKNMKRGRRGRSSRNERDQPHEIR